MNNIEIDLELVTKTFEKGINDAVRAAAGFQKSVNSNFDKIEKSLKDVGKSSEKAGKDIAGSFGKANIAVGAFFGNLAAQTFTGVIQGIQDVSASIVQLGKESLLAVVDAEETNSKFNTVFKDLAKSSSEAVTDLVNNYGLASTESKKLLSSTGDLLSGFGFSQAAALKLSSSVQKLSVDVASFQNLQGGAARASEIVTKALLGETEGLVALGVKLSAKAVESRIATNASQGLTFATNNQAKAQATLDLIMEQSANSIGDYARTSDSTANQLRKFDNTIIDLKEAIGKGLEPTFRSAIQQVNEFLKSLDVKQITAFVASGVKVGVDALGNLVDGFSSVIRIVNIVNGVLPDLGNGLKVLTTGIVTYELAVAAATLKTVGFSGAFAALRTAVLLTSAPVIAFIGSISLIPALIATAVAGVAALAIKFDVFGSSAEKAGKTIDEDFNGVIANTKKEIDALNKVELGIFDELGNIGGSKKIQTPELVDNTAAANVSRATPEVSNDDTKKNAAKEKEETRHQNVLLKIRADFLKRSQQLTLESSNTELLTKRAANEQELRERLAFNVQKADLEIANALSLNEKLSQTENKKQENELKINNDGKIKRLELESKFAQDLLTLNLKTEEERVKAERKSQEDELKRKTEFNEAKNALDAEISEARALFNLEKQASEIESEGLRNEAQLTRLRDLELQKLDIIKASEIQKAKLIQDNDTRILKFKEINLKNQLAKEKILYKGKQQIEKAKEKLSLDGFNSVLSATDEFFSAAQVLAGQDAKKKKRLALAQALISGYQAVVNGFATAPFFPAGLAAGAIATAKTVATISKIRSTNVGNFATGGIIGGGNFAGDNLVANVNSGEAILNTQQQKNFMNIANGAESGGNSYVAEAINNLGDRISNMEIVLRADDTEIARSVSRGVRDGIVIGESR